MTTTGSGVFWQSLEHAGEFRSILAGISNENAVNLLYTWLHSRALRVGDSLWQLPVHESAAVADGLGHLRTELVRHGIRREALRRSLGTSRRGGVAVMVGGRECAVEAGDYLLHDDDTVTVCRRRLYPRADRLAVGVASRMPLTRFFWRVSGRCYLQLGSGAAEDLALLCRSLDEAGLPYEAKIYVPAEGTLRSDPVILYFPLGQWRAFMTVLATCLPGDRFNPAAPPSLALPIAPGVSMAVSDSSGGSFGVMVARMALAAVCSQDTPAEALRHALDALGRSSGHEYATEATRKIQCLDEIPGYFQQRSTSGLTGGPVWPRALARGAPFPGCPSLLSEERPTSAFSGVRRAFVGSWDVYSGSAGWAVAVSLEDGSVNNELASVTEGTLRFLGTAAFRHGYLSGTLGAIACLAALTKGSLTPRLQRQIESSISDAVLTEPQSWDLSSGAAGTLVAANMLLSVSPGLVSLPHFRSALNVLLEAAMDGCPPENSVLGLAHGSAGVALACVGLQRLGVIDSVRAARWVKDWAVALPTSSSEDDGRWCDGLLAAQVIAVAGGLFHPGRLSLTLRALTSSLLRSPPEVIDMTTCHGLPGLSIMASAVQRLTGSADCTERLHAKIQRLDEAFCNSDGAAGQYLDRVSSTPSAGLFDGPLGMYVASRDRRQQAGRVCIDLLFPGLDIGSRS